MRAVTIILVGVCVGAVAGAVIAGEADTITIRGETYTVVPDEELRALGFELPEVAPEENAALDYLKAIEAYQPPEQDALRDEVLERGWSDEAAPLATYLEENEGTLALLERAAGKDACHFPVLIEQGKTLGDDMSLAELHLPSLTHMREFARFLVTDGKAREFEGRYAEALDAYLMTFRIGSHVAQDPILMNGLLGIACDTIGMKAIEQCIVRNELDEETLARAQKGARELWKQRPSVIVAMGGERVFSMEMTEYLIKNPSWLWKWNNGQPEFGERVWAAMIQTEQGAEQARKEMRAFWEFYDDALKLPLRKFLEKEGDFKSRTSFELPPKVVGMVAPGLWKAWPLRLVIVRMLTPGLWRVRIQYGRADLSWNVLDAMFALARYKAKHGEYPETLDEAKGLMLSDGTDPFTGKALKYRLEEDGSFTIWSVGDNLKDDGGKVGTKHNPWRGDDHVWNSRLLAGMK